jgi:hypothetical protein
MRTRALLQKIMRADSEQDVCITFNAEDNAIVEGHATLPAVFVAFDFLDLEGGVAGISKQEPQRFVHAVLNMLG